MESKRLFVGNIPTGVSEADLKSEFSCYGNINLVELKTKENLVNPESPNIFAFITMDITNENVEQCIQEFSEQKYRGQYLTVSVARESFLDRLKRERDEAAIKKTSTSNTILNTTKSDGHDVEKIKAIFTRTASRSSSSASSSSDSEKEELIKKPKFIDEENYGHLSKKRASTSIQNGKIKIKSHVDSQPIHVITSMKDKKSNNILDDRGKLSDAKRLKSLENMKNQHGMQKLAIQKALSSADIKNRKIVFDDAESDSSLTTKNNSKKLNLFNQSDEDDVGDENKFQVKAAFTGRKGEQLMKLQSTFPLDSRFQVNEKFLDNDSNAESDTDPEQLEDERTRQLEIIEEVIGHKIKPLSLDNRKRSLKTMLRFDPSEKNHEKYIKSSRKCGDGSSMVESKAAKQKNVISKNCESEVSKNQFYKINEDLAQSLKRRGEGFSLLSMFGKQDELDVTQKSQDVSEEKILITKGVPQFDNNPFKFDSSDDEVEKSDVNTKTNNKVSKNGIWNESFFILNDDLRLKDGANFFMAVKKSEKEDITENYDEIKEKLRIIINKKISKTKKNILKNKGGIIGKSKFKKRK